MKLKHDFYIRDDVVQIARDLLGKYLMTNIRGIITGAKIIETEAYAGITDKASHAYGGKRTPRTEIMYSEGGRSYVYLCYGVHYLFNVVTNIAEIPHAVLIRGVEAVDGTDEMLKRTNKKNLNRISDGPGKLTKALGVNLNFNKLELSGDRIWIEDRGGIITNDKILISSRIGVEYADEDARLPYRFNLIQ